MTKFTWFQTLVSRGKFVFVNPPTTPTSLLTRPCEIAPLFIPVSTLVMWSRSFKIRGICKNLSALLFLGKHTKVLWEQPAHSKSLERRRSGCPLLDGHSMTWPHLYANVICPSQHASQIKLSNLAALLKFKSRFCCCIAYFSSGMFSETYFNEKPQIANHNCITSMLSHQTKSFLKAEPKQDNINLTFCCT